MPYQDAIAHFTDIQKPLTDPNFIHANFNTLTRFKRVGIHHINLLPGRRTSFPHCESNEEEFVYVISGSPDLWLDGYIYPLKPQDAVGFPAGTGISHTVINNTLTEVRLLVVGEISKPDNKWWYPLNPEKQGEYAANWWTDAPKPKLGPHNGKAGVILDRERGSELRHLIVNAMNFARKATFSYPNSTETFGAGVRLTTKLNMKVLGIWHECLAPGKRSSWPHAHTHEEEFCFILSGYPTVWLNGYVHQLKPGDGVAFRPNTNVSHCLINDRRETVEYIGIGETEEFKDEKIIYPMHPERNEEMRAQNFLWENRPLVDFGSHDGKPSPIDGSELDLGPLRSSFK